MTDTTAKTTRKRAPAKTTAAKTAAPKTTRARKPKAAPVAARAPLDPFRRALLGGVSIGALALA